MILCVYNTALRIQKIRYKTVKLIPNKLGKFEGISHYAHMKGNTYSHKGLYVTISLIFNMTFALFISKTS